MTDPREFYERALAQTEQIVAAVRPDQLGDHTPCRNGFAAEQAVPPSAVAGARYMPAVLAHMDSEHAG